MPKATLYLQKTYFDLVKTGRKTVDGRINRQPFSELKPGDSIRFVDKTNHNDEIICAITRIASYQTFKQMLENENLQALLPGMKSVEEGIRIYNSFTDYTKDVEIYGALAIEFLPLTPKNKKKTKIAHTLSKKKAGQL